MLRTFVVGCGATCSLDSVICNVWRVRHDAACGLRPGTAGLLDGGMAALTQNAKSSFSPTPDPSNFSLNWTLPSCLQQRPIVAHPPAQSVRPTLPPPHESMIERSCYIALRTLRRIPRPHCWARRWTTHNT